MLKAIAHQVLAYHGSLQLDLLATGIYFFNGHLHMHMRSATRDRCYWGMLPQVLNSLRAILFLWFYIRDHKDETDLRGKKTSQMERHCSYICFIDAGMRACIGGVIHSRLVKQ